MLCKESNVSLYFKYKQGLRAMAILSSFPIIYKVGNTGIFIQLLMEISCKQIRA